MGLARALDEWRDETALSRYGSSLYNMMGGSLIMPDVVIKRIVDFAHIGKITSRDEFLWEVTWLHAPTYADALCAIIDRHRQDWEEPAPQEPRGEAAPAPAPKTQSKRKGAEKNKAKGTVKAKAKGSAKGSAKGTTKGKAKAKGKGKGKGKGKQSQDGEMQAQKAPLNCRACGGQGHISK